MGWRGFKFVQIKDHFVLKNIGGPHVILKIYKIYPYTIVYSIGVDLINFLSNMVGTYAKKEENG